jgi:hypothetical protein
MADSVLSGVNRSLANMIPLLMRKQQMDWEREKWDMRESEKEEELLLEAEKVKFETGKQLYLEGIKSGNQGLAQSGGAMAEKFMPGLNLPKEQITPGSMGGPMREDAMGGMAVPSLEQYTVPGKEEDDYKAMSPIGKIMSDMEQLPEGHPHRKIYEDAIKNLVEKMKTGGKEPRAQKAYMTPEGKIEFLPNNVKPPKGYKPYSTGDNFIKHQELLSLREQKRSIRRDISNYKRLPNLDIYKGQKDSIISLEDELEELRQREKEILGKTKQSDPLGIR